MAKIRNTAVSNGNEAERIRNNKYFIKMLGEWKEDIKNDMVNAGAFDVEAFTRAKIKLEAIQTLGDILDFTIASGKIAANREDIPDEFKIL